MNVVKGQIRTFLREAKAQTGDESQWESITEWILDQNKALTLM